MSLRVWLPLISNTKNLGLCGDNLITSNVTFNDGGKIGGKYLSGGTITIPASISKTFFNKNHMSFTFWLYPIGSTSSSVIMGRTAMSAGDNRMYSIFQYSTPNDLHLSWQDETSSSTFLEGAWSGFFPANTWTHCCIVYDGKKVMIYRNGELYTTANGTSNRNNFEYDFPIVGSPIRKLNDVRIYDHCLSPMEVKEISKGLILHYPLNRGGWGQENLLKNSQGIIVDKTGNTSGSGTEYYAWDVGDSYTNITINTVVTISFDLEMYVNDLTTYGGTLQVYNTNNKGPVQISRISYTFKNKYAIGETINERVSLTTTLIPRSDANKTNNYIEFYTGYGSDNFYKISNVKLELGSIATPWCPNSSDILATTIGLNNNVEYDCSGYCNNGTRMGTFSWMSDTPKYNVSTEFNTNNYIIINPLTIDMNNVSFAIWVKWDVFNSYSRIWDFGQVASGGGYCCFLMNDATNGSIKLRLRNASGAELLNDNFITANTNTWYHIAFTLSNTTCKVYVNGVLKNTKTLSSNIGTAIFNYPYIGKSNWSTDALLDGKLSDFRIYATALSAEDVKDLYELGATIDTNGVLSTYEFTEQ